MTSGRGAPSSADSADASAVLLVDVAALHPTASEDGPTVLWSASNQLQTNLVSLPPEAGIGWHAETVLDVTLTLLGGHLTVRHGPSEDDCTVVQAIAPTVLVLPAGTRRSLTAGATGATYLTAHRARPGLLPTVR